MQQHQRFIQTNVDRLATNNSGISLLPATYNHIQIITSYQLKQLFDNFVRLPLLTINDLTDMLYLLDRIENRGILTDPLVVNHRIYFIYIDILKDLLKKLHTINYLTQIESSYLFRYIIKLFCKINLHSIEIVKPLRKCLNDIAKHGRYLHNENNIMKYLSKLIELYIQDEQIMNAIINCLCSNFYLQMFQQIEKVDQFLLMIFPTYFIIYQGQHKEEMAHILLNTLLKSTAYILKFYFKSKQKPVIQLLKLLNHSLQLCTSTTIFEIDQLISTTDTLLLILDDKSLSIQNNKSFIKYSIDFLLILIKKNNTILNYVHQKENIFHKFIDLDNNNVHEILNYLSIHNENKNNNDKLLVDIYKPVLLRRDEDNSLQ
ncbi:unnamed protein product, partial [Rotaria sordida]